VLIAAILISDSAETLPRETETLRIGRYDSEAQITMAQEHSEFTSSLSKRGDPKLLGQMPRARRRVTCFRAFRWRRQKVDANAAIRIDVPVWDDRPSSHQRFGWCASVTSNHELRRDRTEP